VGAFLDQREGHERDNSLAASIDLTAYHESETILLQRSLFEINQAPEPVVDFLDLEIFRAVAAERSVTRAAERLQRVQSNVTTRVRQLEEELGVPLFLRDGKRMTLTPQGQTLLGYANRLLALAEEARQALHPEKPSGHFRIGTMESTAASRLPTPLVQFHSRWPEVTLELSTGPTQSLIEQVLGHELDCALIARPPAAEAEGEAGLGPDLEGVRVFVEELLLVLPARHPDVTDAADLQVGVLATLEPGCTYRRLAEDWLARGRSAGDRPVKRLELGSYHAILACVSAGTSIGVVPRSVLELQRDPLDIRTHSLGCVDILLIRRRGYRSAAFDAFLQILQGVPVEPPTS